MFPNNAGYKAFVRGLVYLHQKEDLNILTVLKSISAIMENREIKLP